MYGADEGSGARLEGNSDRGGPLTVPKVNCVVAEEGEDRGELSSGRGLTIAQMREWVEVYREKNRGEFPTRNSGEILNADGTKSGETWNSIHALFRSAAKGYPARGLNDCGFASLSDFLDKSYATIRIKRIQKPDLSLEQLKAWVEVYREKNAGKFPTARSGEILNTDGTNSGESWNSIHLLFKAAAKGAHARGLNACGFTSLNDFLDSSYADLRTHKPNLSVEQIKEWIEVYRDNNAGKFPTAQSGEILNTDGTKSGEKWHGINALFRAAASGASARGLKDYGFTSLKDFLDKSYADIRIQKPDLSLEQIRTWIEVYRGNHDGRLPTARSGEIFNADGTRSGENWDTIDALFRAAANGAPARGLKAWSFTSLKDLLAKSYAAISIQRIKKPDLSLEQIKEWIEFYRENNNGKFPGKHSGDIFHKDGTKSGEGWNGIDQLLRAAANGAPARGLNNCGFTSLTDLLYKSYAEIRIKKPDLSLGQIKQWIEIYRRRNGSKFPTARSGEILNSDGTKSGEKWRGIDTLLKASAKGAPARGLKDCGFASLRDFIDKSYADIRIQKSDLSLELLKDLFNGPEAAALRNLAEKLGESALAEYLVAAHPDKFQAYGPELIENLRPYLGELEQTPRAETSEALPNEIFTLDKLAYLRQAYFNYYRDLLQPEYAKGLDVVIERIEEQKRAISSSFQQEFMESLAEYFRAVDQLEHPSRLRESLGGSLKFPAAHQMMAMYEVSQGRRILLADEMGGGKTGSAIGSFELLRDQGQARRALVICPAKVVPVWQERLSDSSGGYFKDGQAPSVAFIDSDSKDWLAAANADYTVISLEMLRGKTNGISNVRLLQQCGFDFLIFDEAHNAKSIKASSSDTERVFAVSQSPTIREGYTILLSGTPIPNTLRDLSAHIRLLYAGTNDQPGVEVDDLQNLAKQILTSHPLTTRNLLVRKMMRRKTEDCLPVGCEYTREQIQADLNPVARAKYAAVLDDPFLAAGPKIGALRRVCLNAKFATLKQAIDRALDDEKYQNAGKPAKIVVAESAYARGVTRNRIDERTQEAPGQESYIYSRLRNTYGDTVRVFVLDGKNSTERPDILEAFDACTKPAILLTLVSVSGEGLNITCAADGILISPTYTVSSEEQFIRRMLRSGQKLPVRLQILNFSDSIEAGISDYSARKHRAVAAVMDGRPLNKRERAILADDFAAIKKNGPIAYESLTPRQQALWILSRLKGLGKDGIKAFLYADNGKYAKDFARGYPADEETSTSGNTARLVASVIEQVGGKGHSPAVIADIACGCRTLERMFEGSRSYTVKSVDINEVALRAGAELLKTPKTTTEDEVRTMDDLPFEDGSLDIGVISLALDMTQHSFDNKRQKSGQERIRTLLEINRALKLGGKAIFSFQESLFSTEEEFNRFISTIENHFGFRRVEGLTGFATAYNQAESERYASWIVTFEKTSSVTTVDTKSDELRKGLRFPHVSRGVPESRGASHGAATQKSGAYQDTFSIGGAELQFKPSTMAQVEAAAAHKLAQAEDIRLGEKVHELLGRYPNISDIPPELLLSITPQQVNGATQSERDKYYRVLIEKYGSEDNIPTEAITDKNSYILIRRRHKTRGDYLCLAKLSKDGKSWVGCKTRYFYQAEK